MKAYVISLDNPIKLLKKISNYGLTPILVNGVNGRLLSNDEINNNCSFLCSILCTKTTIGIAMSHIKVWEQFIESNDNYGIVFEDDVIFTPNFKYNLDVILHNLKSNSDIVYLGCFGCSNSINLFSAFGYMTNSLNIDTDTDTDTNYLNKSLISLATHGYIISKSGAKKLVKLIKGNIYNHLDFQIQRLIKDKLINSYVVNNLLVYQTSTNNLVSYNTANNHPLLINELLSNFHIEKYVRANYVTTVGIMKIGNYNFTVFAFLFIITGLILSASDFNLLQLSIAFFILSIPDIYSNYSNHIIYIHYLLFIGTFLLFRYFDVWNKLDNSKNLYTVKY
jgi:GR25 family glycosyltransferase involved in LPS biosynthesis